MTNELSELGKAAVAYAEMGLALIPLKARGKEPCIKGGSTKATANVEQVRNHWMRQTTTSASCAATCRTASLPST
mgnify:CR=1 FL=1